jgi:hypothetical protein
VYINYPPHFQPAYVSSNETSSMDMFFPALKVGCPPGLSLEKSCGLEEKGCETDSEQNLLQPAFLTDMPRVASCAQSQVLNKIHSQEVGALLKAAAALTHAKTQERKLEWTRNGLGDDQCATVCSQMQQNGGARRHMRSRKRMCLLRIASHLNELEKEDPNKILILRRINRLGFKSGEILKEHYERYGEVRKVLLSNAHTRNDDTPYQVRLRPSGIGYVLFERAEDAERALLEGEKQVVAGVEIFARAFQGKQPSEDGKDAEGNDGSEGSVEGKDDVDFAAEVTEYQKCKAAP